MTKITTDFNGSENATVRASRRKEIHDFWFGDGSAVAEGTFAGVRANINGIYDPDTSNAEAFGSWLTKWNALNEPDKLLNDTLKDDADANIFVLADDTARLFTDEGVTPVSAPGNSIRQAWDDWLGDVAQKGVQNTAAARPTWGRAPAQVWNLLTNSDLSGAVAGTPGTAPTGWTLTHNTGAITAVAADGLLGGNSVRVVASSQRISIGQAITVLPSTVYRFSVLAEVYSGAVRVDHMIDFFAPPSGSVITWEIDGASVAGSVAPAAGLRTLTAILTVSTTGGGATARAGLGTLNNVTCDIRFWAPRLTLAADASLPYQRRGATPTDITESGVTSFGLLSLDGSDDALLHQLAAGGTVSVALFGRGGSYLIPSITLAAPSVLQLGPLSVLDDGVLVSDCPTGILRAVGTVPWSSRFELVGYAIMKANPSAEEQARAMRYFAAFGARGWLVETLIYDQPFDSATGVVLSAGATVSGGKLNLTTDNNSRGEMTVPGGWIGGAPYRLETVLDSGGAAELTVQAQRAAGFDFSVNALTNPGVFQGIFVPVSSGFNGVRIISTPSSGPHVIDRLRIFQMTPEF